MVLLVIVFLVLLGIVIFFARPKLFFIYWLSIYAFVLPIIYLPLKSSFSPFDKFMPILGNGRSYRKDYYYGKPTEAYNNEGSFKVDARLAFMFVEYGIIGLSLFFFLFFSIFKGCFMYIEEHKKVIYVGAMIYFLLNSITDSGFWDYIIFSSVLIYVFSINNNKNVGECIVSYNDAVKSLGRIES